MTGSQEGRLEDGFGLAPFCRRTEKVVEDVCGVARRTPPDANGCVKMGTACWVTADWLPPLSPSPPPPPPPFPYPLRDGEPQLHGCLTGWLAG